MREGKRTRIITNKVELTKFSNIGNGFKTSDYQIAKDMLNLGYSTKAIFKKFHLLRNEKKNLQREEQLLNIKSPNREIYHQFEETKSISSFNTISKIHNDVVSIFSSNENLRNFALPQVE